jgi:hypothetical protein
MQNKSTICSYINLQALYFINSSADEFTNRFLKAATNRKLSKMPLLCTAHLYCSGVPRNFFRGGGSTKSVEDRGQRTGIWAAAAP